MTCNGTGIFSTGNRNPLNSSVGRNKLIIDANWAVRWVLAAFEIRIPRDSAVMVNNVLSAINNHKLPTIGTSSTNTLSNMMQATLSMDTSR